MLKSGVKMRKKGVKMLISHFVSILTGLWR
jgi:hypothetical protein